MQNLQISDTAASVLYELAESEHISAETLMERLVTAHKEEIIKITIEDYPVFSAVNTYAKLIFIL